MSLFMSLFMSLAAALNAAAAAAAACERVKEEGVRPCVAVEGVAVVGTGGGIPHAPILESDPSLRGGIGTIGVRARSGAAATVAAAAAAAAAVVE